MWCLLVIGLKFRKIETAPRNMKLSYVSKVSEITVNSGFMRNSREENIIARAVHYYYYQSWFYNMKTMYALSTKKWSRLVKKWGLFWRICKVLMMKITSKMVTKLWTRLMFYSKWKESCNPLSRSKWLKIHGFFHSVL